MIDKIAHALALIVVLFAIILTAVYSFLIATPASFWFEYVSVESFGEQKINKPLRFKSNMIVRRTATLSWNDVLRCQNGLADSYVIHSTQDTKGVCLPPTKEFVDVHWTYRHGITEPTVCYMVSNITISLPFGIVKTVSVEGETFEVVQ
jgi:hypothetical protein